jgi:hypothetical protein
MSPWLRRGGGDPPPREANESLPFRRARRCVAGSSVARMTVVWFLAWLITTLFITDAPLQFDPVNWWAGLLLAAVALDLAGAQAKNFRH